MSKKLHRFTNEQKKQILELHERGIKPKAIAHRFNCSRRKIYDTIKSAKCINYFTEEEEEMLTEYLKENCGKRDVTTAELQALFPRMEYYALRNKKLSILRRFRKLKSSEMGSSANSSCDDDTPPKKTVKRAQMRFNYGEAEGISKEFLVGPNFDFDFPSYDFESTLHGYNEAADMFLDQLF